MLHDACGYPCILFVDFDCLIGFIDLLFSDLVIFHVKNKLNGRNNCAMLWSFNLPPSKICSFFLTNITFCPFSLNKSRIKSVLIHEMVDPDLIWR